MTKTYLSHNQCHGCWWPGDIRSQVINSHDIDLVLAKYSGLSSSRFVYKHPRPRFNIKTIFPRHGIPMLKIRRSWGRLIFNMGIPILERWHLYIDTAPRVIEEDFGENGRSVNVHMHIYHHIIRNQYVDWSWAATISLLYYDKNMWHIVHLSRLIIYHFQVFQDFAESCQPF